MSEAASPTGLSRNAMVVPIANVSTLSQAWIDALGLARHQPTTNTARAPQAPQAASVRIADAKPVPRNASRGVEAQPARLPATERGAKRSQTHVARTRLADIDRLRVKKQIASVHPPQPDVFRRSAGRVNIITRRGTVRLLMQRDADRLRITTVCDPRLMSSVSDALRASQVAYAARGVRMHASLHASENAS